MAQYTALDAIDLPELSQQYGLTDAEARPLKGGAANSSFRLDTPDGRSFVLTALDNHDADSAARLARINIALETLGVPTTRIVPSRNGDLVVMLGDRPFLLKEWIEGRVEEPLPPQLVRRAGELLAELHLLPSAELDLPAGTRRLSSAHRAAIDEFRDRDFAGWLDRWLTIAARDESAHRRAPVVAHGDLFSDNLLVTPDGQLAIIDWETVSLDDPLLDLGMAAVGLAQHPAGKLDRTRLDLLVEGYNSVRPITAEDRSALPTEVIHAAVIIAFHRYFRHNVRFPNPERTDYYQLMVEFVETVPRTL